MLEKFKYEKFRKPECGETFHKFFYELFQHLESEFERLTEYVIAKQDEVNNDRTAR